MSQEITRIKARIKSVSGALKVTSAMKLVSAVKLKRWKNKMIANRNYSEQISSCLDEVLSHSKNKNNPYICENEKATKDLYIIVSSTLGLCGSYNANIFKLADAEISENDDAIILGNKGMVHYEGNKVKKIDDFSSYTGIQDDSIIKSITDLVIEKYLNNEYKTIHLIYSSYKNSLVFLAKDFVVLPLNAGKEEDYFEYPPIMEPNADAVLERLIPIYLKTVIYSRLLESEVCEQASRNNAMNNATDNANEILNQLQIEFNKARQGAITQEIIEITAASKAI